MKRIPVVEGRPIEVDPITASAIRKRVNELQDELRPRIKFLSNTDNPTIWNLVGSVQVSHDLVLDIRPKTEPGQDWARSLVELMTTERVAFGGQHDNAEWNPRTPLPEVFAAIYARQLLQAVRREGPLTLLIQRQVSQSRLSGKLNVSRWLIERTTAPHRFPQSQTSLSADNRYTSAMAWVADMLATRTTDLSIRNRLKAAARELRPGLPEHTILEPGIAFADIPPQWAAYGAPWSTARAIIRRISPLHRSGVLHGLGLAIEPWPLLEVLLTRAVQAAADQGRTAGMNFHAPAEKIQHPLLTPQVSSEDSPLSRIHTPRSVEPDAVLYLDDKVIATFEAKYNQPTYRSTRDHFFQAITTAAAMDSPISVLVYPEEASPVVWHVTGFDGKPKKVVTLGVDMFSYRRRSGDAERGAHLLDLIVRELALQDSTRTTIVTN